MFGGDNHLHKGSTSKDKQYSIKFKIHKQYVKLEISWGVVCHLPSMGTQVEWSETELTTKRRYRILSAKAEGTEYE